MRGSSRLGGLVLTIALVIGACGSDANKTASPTVTSTESLSASTTNTTSTSSTSGVFTGGSAPVDACKLSEIDISSVVGFTVKKRDGSNESDCIFASPDPFGPGGPPGGGGDSSSAGVEFQVTPFRGGASEAKAAVDEIASPVGANVVEVSGVGDKAYFVDPPNEITGILVFSGTRRVSVSIDTSDQDPTDRREQLVALAKKLLS